MTPSPQEIVAAGYDAIAGRYADWQSQIIDDPRERYVRKLLSLTPERPDILEIGCGGGVEPTPTFASQGRLVGIDISQAQIERARRAVPDAELIHGDVTTTEFDAGSFHAVVALFVLTHIPTSDLPELLSAILGWLRDGGVFLGTFGSGRADESVVDDWLGAPMFFSNVDERGNEALLRSAGFTIIESRVETMHEPPSEPGKEQEAVAFHWLLAHKPTAWSRHNSLT